MRRLSSLFHTRRDRDKSTQQPITSHNHSSRLNISFIPLLSSSNSHSHSHSPSSTPSTPILSFASDPAHSSASSSGSASLCLHTPSDDHHVKLVRNSTKRSWKSWIGAKRSSPTLKLGDTKDKDWEHVPAPPLAQPNPPAVPPLVSIDTDEEDTLSDSDVHSEMQSNLGSLNTTKPPALSFNQAKENLLIFTKNSLIPPLPTPVFVQHSASPVFPRSCNRTRILSPSHSLRSNILKTNILKRLEGPASSMTHVDETAILPFSLRPAPAVQHPTTLSSFNEVMPSNMTKVFSASPGLGRWITRPCFEDRFVVFLPIDGVVARLPVVGSAFAVAALEFSEVIDVMIDPDFDPSSPPPNPTSAWDSQTPKTQQQSTDPGRSSHVLSPTQSSVQITNLPQTHIDRHPSTTPAPIHNTPSETKPGPVPETAVKVSRMQSLSVTSTVKRVVRFVEEDDDDGVPLHIVRMKKMREQKALFLRREQLKRLKEEDEERRRQEQEHIERERLRIAREKEKREMERKLYADEISATRMRRDMARVGGPKSQGSLITSSGSSSSLRDLERNKPHDSRRDSSRSVAEASPIPRRELLDSPTTSIPVSNSHPRYDSSPSGSFQTSPGFSPVTPSSLGGLSRPPSNYFTHYSSSEDVRQASGGSRRNSFVAAAAASQRAFQDSRTSGFYPMWSGSNQSLHSTPPIPPIPTYMHDMPLLPPSAPFMMQNTREARRSSPGPSNSSGSLRGGSANSSTERVNLLQTHHNRFSPTSPYSPIHSSTSSPGSTSDHKPSWRHEQRTTDEKVPDPRRMSMPIQQKVRSQSQLHDTKSPPNSVSHGRTPLPNQQAQVSSPWTAPPSKSGRPPLAMPNTSHFQSNSSITSKGKQTEQSGSRGARRQATIS